MFKHLTGTVCIIFFFSQHQYAVCLKIMCENGSAFYDPAACNSYRTETIRLISNLATFVPIATIEPRFKSSWSGGFYERGALFQQRERRSYIDDLKNVLCWSVFGPEADGWCQHWVLLKCSWGRKRLQVGTQCLI